MLSSLIGNYRIIRPNVNRIYNTAAKILMAQGNWSRNLNESVYYSNLGNTSLLGVMNVFLMHPN